MIQSSHQSASSQGRVPGIDRLFLATGGSVLLWLVFGGLVQLGAFVKFACPGVLSVQFLQFPRLLAVSDILELHGGLGALVFAAVGWLMSRFQGRSSTSIWLLWCGLLCWNVGLLIGVVDCFVRGPGAFFQDHLSYCSKSLLYFGWLLSGFWVIPRIASCGFRNGFEFLFSGLLWFYVFFFASVVVLRDPQVLGIPEVFLSQWVAGALRYFVAPCLGFGLIMYLCSLGSSNKPVSADIVTGRGLFWVFVGLGPFVGLARLASGPVPLWVGGVGSAVGLLWVVPALGVSLALDRSLRSLGPVDSTIYMRFFRGSIVFFAGCLILNALVSWRGIDTVARFTLFDLGASRLVSQGFGAFCVLGVTGFILSRILPGYSDILIFRHWSFLLCAYGVGSAVLLLVVAGLFAGGDMNAVDVSFAQAVESYAFFASALIGCSFLYLLGLCLFGMDFLVGIARSRF